MRRACLVFATLAALGLVLSAVVHVSTFFGIDPLDLVPWVWLLHIGIFVVFIPAMAWEKRPRVSRGRASGFGFPGAPRWMAWMAGLLAYYAVVNFVVFLFLVHEGSPARREDGTYAITSHGRLVRPVSAEEFHRHQAYVARGFSGHWMLFYSASLTALVARARTPPGQ